MRCNLLKQVGVALLLLGFAFAPGQLNATSFDVLMIEAAKPGPLNVVCKGMTIDIACPAPRAELVKQLLAKGANINATDEEGRTALIWAAIAGDVPTVKVLLDHGADLTIKDKGGKTALQAATEKKHQEVVALIKAKAGKQ
jgi:hypothetical protein